MNNWQKIKLNPKLKEIQVKRAEICDLIRYFFKKKGFLEMQTPTLVPCAGQEPYLSPIKVDFKDDKGKKYEGFLITSPEYSLKKLLSAGFTKMFELAKVFRGKESFGGIHNTEFTMLEWYRAKSDYRQIMKDTESLVYFLNKKINKSGYLNYQGKKIDLSMPWPRIKVKEAFLKYAGVNLDKAKTLKTFKSQIKNKEYLADDWNSMFYSVFLNEIEPKLRSLNKPYFLYDYPLSQAWLSRKKASDPRFAERFEVFLAGIELGNCFSELLDSKEQELRLKKSHEERRSSGKSLYPVDKELIKALDRGLPEVSGIAVGVDRLIMLAGNFESISDTLFFPAQEIFDLPNA